MSKKIKELLINKREMPDDVKIIGEIYSKNKEELLEYNGVEDLSEVGTFEKKHSLLGYLPTHHQDEYVAVYGKSYKKFFILLLFLFLLCVGGLLFYFNKNQLPIDPNAKDFESLLKRPADIDESKILVPGYKDLYMTSSEGVIDTVFFNPEGNPCYFRFILKDKTTKKIVYKSDLVPPGKGISPITLRDSYDVGVYKLSLEIKSYDFEDTDIQYNGANVDVDLNVL